MLPEAFFSRNLGNIKSKTSPSSVLYHNDLVQKKNDSECIGIAEGGARTRDLEVGNIEDDKSHTLYRLSYPGRSD